jgi:xanthine dehydrogenase accessory factor
MHKDLELWQFVVTRLKRGEGVILLIVAESSGSSPGREGYKMAVGADSNLFGSIGGGVMEINLVERSRALLSEPPASAGGQFVQTQIIEQVHQKNSPNASGMICSGRQTVIMKVLTPSDAVKVGAIIDFLAAGERPLLLVTEEIFAAGIPECASDANPEFNRSRKSFTYSELLGPQNQLFIIGGGHCSLALSELMSKLDFRITIFDDRPDLNTIEKNQFADEIRIVDSYEKIGGVIPAGPDVYVVVMTVGYASDDIAIRGLIDMEFKYFGVLGSKAKMTVLLWTLEKEGVALDRLSRIRTPVGLPINSHTPEEIAVSIAAEIISVKNSA